MNEARIDLFTETEIRAAKKIMQNTATPHEAIVEKVVTEEVMARIDAETGQPNDRSYVAYRLEYIASQH